MSEISESRDDERLVTANLIGCGFNDPKQLTQLLRDSEARKAERRNAGRTSSLADLVSVFQRGGAKVKRG